MSVQPQQGRRSIDMHKENLLCLVKNHGVGENDHILRPHDCHDPMIVKREKLEVLIPATITENLPLKSSFFAQNSSEMINFAA